MRAIKRLLSIAIFMVFGLATAGAMAFDASEDIANAADSGLLARFPYSKIAVYEQRPVEDYRLALGALKKINGVLVPEKEARVSGALTRITYQIPNSYESREVFDHFSKLIKAQSHNLLFECRSRECGSSNHWANRIFDIARLYGPDRNQHYLAARLKSGQQEWVVVIYAIKRGNKRVYAQLDLIELQQGLSASSPATPAAILKVLNSQGRFVLSNLTFDNDNQLSPNASTTLQPVAELIRRNGRLSLALVGHLEGQENVVDLMKRSELRAKRVVAALVALGVEVDRLAAYGVGPLAPQNLEDRGSDVGRIELVLLNQR